MRGGDERRSAGVGGAGEFGLAAGAGAVATADDPKAVTHLSLACAGLRSALTPPRRRPPLNGSAR